MLPAQARTTGARRSGSRAIHLTLAALVVLFLAGHLAWLVTSPSDIDEMNFVLGVRRFDVTAHQPHPPGYPVFIALGKLARPISKLAGPAPLELGGAAAIESRALAFWAALFGALALVSLFVFFRSLEGRADLALAATAVTAAAPLYWFTAGRPLSDAPGLAAVLLVYALLVTAWHRQHALADSPDAAAPAWSPERLMLASALAAGLTAGIRSQTFWLVAPLFLLVVAAWRGDRTRLVVRTTAAWLAGVMMWMVPMLLSTGGIQGYLDALEWQAGHDFARVEMLVRDPSPRLAVSALQNTFGAPWATREFAGVMLGLALIGAGAMAWRGRRGALVIGIAFGPYAAFHLLFQETATTRYALPLVPALAYLATRGLERVVRRLLPLVVTLSVVALLVPTLPSYVRYVRSPSPVFAALRAISDRLSIASAPTVVSAHEPFRRALEGVDVQGGRVLRAPAGREVAQLVERWLQGSREPVLFLSDPRKRVLTLIDPTSRKLTAFRWSFRRERFLGGIRPDLVDLVELDSPPGWVCTEGWALTPDTGGVVHPDRREPHLRPAVALVRRRKEGAVLMIGGRHLAPGIDPRPVRLAVAIDGREVASWAVRADPDWFLEFVDLEAGRLEGNGPFATLTVSARADGEPPPPIGLEQFDIQSAGALVWSFYDGWHVREFDERTGQMWRWTTERATLVARAPGRDLTMTLVGQSPLADLDEAPTVIIRAGDREIARLTPSAEFTEEVRVPADALDQSGGLIVIETDRMVVPAEWGIGSDRRRLGLRIFELTLR